ncbi:MAG TPA: acylneuraminate cytidylyltransferase family protein [Egibacteraceae bacterium]
MTTLALVPARGGSKGLPGKNLALVGGRTLVARAVEAALAVARIDEVAVSSDDAAILAEARRAGATPLHRPAALAGDEATTIDLVRAVLAERDDVDVLVVLQPTSPLREPVDVERCLDALTQAPAAATVCALNHPPSWLLRIDERGALEPLGGWDDVVRRRQDAAPVYALNGAVYAARAAHLRAGGELVGPLTAAVVMPPERSVDVDDALDLQLARVLAGAVTAGA